MRDGMKDEHSVHSFASPYDAALQYARLSGPARSCSAAEAAKKAGMRADEVQAAAAEEGLMLVPKDGSGRWHKHVFREVFFEICRTLEKREIHAKFAAGEEVTQKLPDAALMRATLVLCLCKLGLVTRTSRIRSKVDHAPLSVCLFAPAHASGSQNP